MRACQNRVLELAATPRLEPRGATMRPLHARSALSRAQPLPCEQLAHHPENRPTVLGEADQRYPQRTDNHESARAVDGIEDPLIATRADHRLELFPDNAVLGEGLGNGLAHDEFGAPVSFGDRIEMR